MPLYRNKIKLGYKPEPIKENPKKTVYYPSLCINDKKLPCEPDDIGKTFNCKMKLILTGIRESTDENKSNFSYDFEVKEIVF